MNISYRSVYNEKTGTWVAAAENVSTSGKKSKLTVQAAAGSSLAFIGALAASQANAQIVIGTDGTSADNGTAAVVGGGNGFSGYGMAIGFQAIAKVSGGGSGVAIGDWSLSDNTGNGFTTAIGISATAQGVSATAIGAQSYASGVAARSKLTI
ncbi:ESPR domain-containing protein [Hydromonas duriensis]|uniref:Type V secretion system putative substrate protein n=1 Tax=Hydromonas duriensis TaxID=1527608 RepID=A0A4R6Y7V3_9BURK|nr:ESPR domain-containing protein [Hydromonas duriensis]TDR31440.1 type V secretion system putative substrate protein [Hydromonas duriensis]